ncbi:stage 0 sporulation family protein [Flavobacterium sp. AG291]|uniref:PSP1 domain-containing protein n=1 Tax=Flavobacterium sp. AG291 TaxID=2184000 RepID=UPI000E0AB5B6|nr:regulatory iron-sulfur-containing complex subunit RicT [Flavobacterium sp. AG291]RDI07916.1 cell fate regulator YaaT (PSP1 superfamily) [Flavobacterium sp. AG291]
MACTNCSTGSKDGQPRGCKNNGTCGTDSCNKLTVFDWLSNMSLPGGEAPFDCVEVRFKNGRKEFYRNTEKLTLSMGDIVATEASPGHDIGIVTLTGELVKVQMKKKNVKDNADIAKIYRKASQKDIDIWSEARDKEEPMKVVAREIAIRLNLEMKISDIEFQGDGSKATFYYTANDRVDFRQLIKDFAREFSTRIEMKQVGFRQEASRLGGIGSCGRELCCSTWLTDFRSVNTSAARYQQLSLNPQKLAGQCGKLKCCLNYELDTYLDALKGLPDMDTKVFTEKGDAVCQKVDIFKGLMWFAYTNNMAHWHVLKADQVKEIVELNKLKQRVSSLEDYAVEEVAPEVEKTFQNAMGQDSLTRFDAPKKRKRPGKDKKRENTPVDKKQQDRPAGDRPSNKIVPANKEARDNRPERTERTNNDKPAGERKPNENRNNNNRPKGERRPNENRNNNAERPEKPRTERPQAERPQGENPNAERPEGERKPNNRNKNRNHKNRNKKNGNDKNTGGSPTE